MKKILFRLFSTRYDRFYKRVEEIYFSSLSLEEKLILLKEMDIYQV